MKKIILALCAVGCMGQTIHAGSIENYAQSFETISENYQKDLRQFLKGLDPQLVKFTPEQEQKFCGLVTEYVDDVYDAAVLNKDALEKAGKKVSKWQVIFDIMERKEMQILAERYDVECPID